MDKRKLYYSFLFIGIAFTLIVGFNLYSPYKENKDFSVYKREAMQEVYIADTIDEYHKNKRMEGSLEKVSIDKEKNTVRYTGENIEVVLFSSLDRAFSIEDLINPTIIVPKNSKITITLINVDNRTSHGMAITDSAPPYTENPMMEGSFGPIIRPMQKAKVYEYPIISTSFDAVKKANYYYIDQYPKHAALGMYGRFIIE